MNSYLPWFHGDFLRSTPGWTFTERAIYWLLLCAQWETGTLPTDLARLSAITGADLETLKAAWPVVGRKFSKARGGLVNRRMEQHRSDYLSYREMQRERGRKGLDARWKKPRGKPAEVIELRPNAKETPP